MSGLGAGGGEGVDKCIRIAVMAGTLMSSSSESESSKTIVGGRGTGATVTTGSGVSGGLGTLADGGRGGGLGGGLLGTYTTAF